MNPSRASIYDAIEKLRGLEGSPSMFQRLAEGYAQRVFPQRFPSLEPRGMNPQGIAVKGWPDAYAIRPDGRLEVMEATMAQDWRRHVRNDLEHLDSVEPGRIAGILFVIWAPAPEPDEENEWRKKVADVGVTADAMTFVFQERLARDLCQPRFAAIWADLLRLPTTCYPFQRIREVEGLFGIEGSAFAPTLGEYEADTVHRSALLAAVTECLQRQGWAWVRGRGATGKTVLAARLALDHESHGGPAYYLDLAAIDTEGQVDARTLFDVLSTRADDDVLFVVDNVHLASELASALHKHWREAGQGSRWLMLGRLRELGTHPRGVARPLEELRPSALELENTEEDLCGVYVRLVRRRGSAAGEPPREVLRRWRELFAADLIAFSAAVIRRLDDLARGRWTLEAADARAYVRDEYLGGSEEERQNLLRLAAMTSIELTTPEEALDIRALEGPLEDRAHRGPLQRGYVLRSEHGRERYRHYRLVHPGLGELVLSSMTPTVDQLRLLTVVASKSPHIAWWMTGRLEALGRVRDAAAILQEAVRESERLIELLTALGLNHAGKILQRLVRLGVWTDRELDEVLARNVHQLARSAFRTPLCDLASFLTYAERALPEAHNALGAELLKPENVGLLAEAALRTPLGDLPSFLTYAERALPEAHKVLVAELQEPENVGLLAEAALRTPLEHLGSFLSLPELGATVLADISADQWRKARNANPAGSKEVVKFLPFARAASRLNRSDLAEATAVSILTAYVPELLPTDFNLKHLSSLLYYGRLDAPSATRDFTRRVATASWLRSQYAGAQAGTIAGFLLSIWWNQPALIRFLHHPELLRRLRVELSQSHWQLGEELTGTLRLLGVADLIRVPLLQLRVRWPGARSVLSALVEPPPGMETIGTVQVQLWLGLRTMARLRRDRVEVPPEHAERMLALWRKGETETERQQAFNEWMIAWLERCAKAGWTLVPDESRFETRR